MHNKSRTVTICTRLGLPRCGSKVADLDLKRANARGYVKDGVSGLSGRSPEEDGSPAAASAVVLLTRSILSRGRFESVSLEACTSNRKG